MRKFDFIYGQGVSRLMKVVVTSGGADLNAPSSPVFGRCLGYIFVDTDSMEFEAVPNPAISASGGAGIQAAQFVVEQGAEAVLTGNVGPNAFGVLQAAGVPVFLTRGGTVREVVQAYMAGSLQTVGGANVQAHTGLRPSGGMGSGMGAGCGIGAGRGMGTGRGMGAGRGIGMRAAPSVPEMPSAEVSRGDELAALRRAADELSQKLSDVTKRMDELSGEK